MSNKRLSYKVFWVTFIGLMLIVLAWIQLQKFLFEPYYISQKTKELRSQFSEIYRGYADGRYDLFDKPEEVGRFEQQFYGLTTTVFKQEDRVDMYVGMTSVPALPLRKPNPAYDIRIHTSAETLTHSHEQEAPLTKLDHPGGREPVSSSFSIAQPSQPATPAIGGSYGNLISILSYWLQEEDFFDELDDGEILIRQMNNSGVGGQRENILIASAKLPDMVHPAGGEAYLFTVATLQPVGDAVKVMGNFNSYFYLIALVLIVLFAILFSRTVTKPLVQLNRVAKRLAKLDFTAAVQFKREDEIGQLAETMNYLSSNLKRTMDELQEANAKLLADIEKEKQLERMRKRFVASVSHELKTPVSLIQGYAEALKDNIRQGTKRDKYADIIVEESSRMAGLVSDLLDLSQLESGRFRLNPAKVPLSETIRSVLHKMSPLLNDKQIRLKVAGTDDEERQVLSDRSRLEQVLINLLSNAVRHAPIQGRVEVKVLETVEQDKVTVEVSNEGSRIPEEDLPHIWDAFYRSDRSGNRDLGGTGIGLSIVKHLLQLHGSEFGARNEEGGVTFFFTLVLDNGLSLKEDA
ncbi:sensor histidine kinase [Paenibacillus sp. SAFN-117]|uniref:sensor histidine kinase n=1 Tax=Paenibacillus sp. SAFN-117 TaxID=3436860 RepID=UPI003F7F0DA7